MPQIRDINVGNAPLTDVEEAKMSGLFHDLSKRIQEAVAEFRAQHGYDNGKADPIEGQTVIVNALLHEAALQAVTTCFVGGDDLLKARGGFMQVFTVNYDRDVGRVMEAFERLSEEKFDRLGGRALGAALITDLVAGARPNLGEAN